MLLQKPVHNRVVFDSQHRPSIRRVVRGHQGHRPAPVIHVEAGRPDPQGHVDAPLLGPGAVDEAAAKLEREFDDARLEVLVKAGGNAE